jgi:hypothetical protein
MNDEQQTQQADDPSGDGWRWVRQGETLELHDMMQADGEWWPTKNAGQTCLKDGMYRRRIEQQAQQADDPSGPGWRDVEPDELLQPGDMFDNRGRWERTGNPGITADEGRGGTYRRRIEPQPEAQPQTQQADDPGGPWWRDVEPDERIEQGDVYICSGVGWLESDAIGRLPSEFPNLQYRRRIEPPQSKPEANPDDPSGPGWRDLGPDEPIEQGDVYTPDGHNWLESDAIGRLPVEFPNRLEFPNLRYRRRIEPQQLSDSEPETMEQLRKQVAVAVRQNVELADELEDVRRSKAAHQRIAKASVSRAQEAEALLAEAERGGQQVNAELQQLREQVQTLTMERDRLQSWLQQHHTTGQQSAIKKLERWLKPVLKVVADHPEDASPLAVAVLGYLPGIASRLIEE